MSCNEPTTLATTTKEKSAFYYFITLGHTIWGNLDEFYNVGTNHLGND